MKLMILGIGLILNANIYAAVGETMFMYRIGFVVGIVAILIGYYKKD